MENFLDDIPLLQSRGHRPLKMTFEQQLKSLILFHLEEHDSARHLLQVQKQDDFARSFVAPPEGIGRSSYCEALNTRGLEQLMFVYEKPQAQATATLPEVHSQLGDLVAIDGSLIDAVCSMTRGGFKNRQAERIYGNRYKGICSFHGKSGAAAGPGPGNKMREGKWAHFPSPGPVVGGGR